MIRGKHALDGLDRDIREHIEHETQDNIDRGMTPGEAHRQAMLKFGNIALAREDTRAVWVWPWLDQLRQDIYYAFRTLRRNPGFAAVAVLTLALGIGATTAIFSVVYATLLKPLPFTNPDELVAMSVYIPQLQAKIPSMPVRPVDFEEFRQSNNVFSGMAAIRERDFNLTDGGEPERLYGARVSASLFPLLGAAPQLGRTFLAEEDTPGRDAVVLISHHLWTSRFGADQAIVNRTLSLDGQPHVVVGVMPAAFPFPSGKQLHTHVELGPRIDVWKPMAFTQSELAPENMNAFNRGVIARLKPGISYQEAQTNLDAIAQRIGTGMRATIPGGVAIDLRTKIVPVRDVFSRDVRRGLVMLMGAVGLLLVIACVNLANLLLARLSSRSRELATRAALGASRGRLIRQLLTESVVLATLGGAAGVPVAIWGTALLFWLSPADFSTARSTLDPPVFLFAMSVVLGVGLAVGVIPALSMGRGNLQGNLTEGGRGMSTGRRTGHLRRALVTAEVALCAFLLVVAGLLLRSFVNVMDVNTGFGVERVLSVDVALSGERYGGSQTVAFYRELLDTVRALPGVTSVGAVNILPLTSQAEGNVTPIYLESDTEQRIDRPIAQYRIVTPGYFTSIGISLVAGRLFEAQEPASVILVTEKLAQGLWPGVSMASVVGRRVRIGEVTDDPVAIAGVVGDVRAAALDREPTPAIYVPHIRNRVRAMTLVIRTAREPETIAAAVRAEVWNRDTAVPVTVRTMRDIVSASVAPRRFQMVIVLLFATLALGLALVGVYGVTSYAVGRQTKEIGLRIALGAQRPVLLRSVLAQGLRPVAAGLFLGLPAAVAAASAMRSLLFGIGPLDPVALCVTTAALLVTAAIACYVPARRAARVDAVVALRAE